MGEEGKEEVYRSLVYLLEAFCASVQEMYHNLISKTDF